MTVAEQDQTVKSEEVVDVDAIAGDVNDKAVDTATTDESTGLATEEKTISIEDIISDAPVEPKTAKEGTDSGVQKRIDRAVKGQKTAEDEVGRLRTENASLKATQAAPKEKPMFPDRDLSETHEEHQKLVDKYQDDLRVWNKAQDVAATQEGEDVSRKLTNDGRIKEQTETLQKKFPDINIKELVDATQYGYAREAIADSEQSVKIAFFLASNPVELARFAAMSNTRVLDKEIGKLESKFESVRKTTKAPGVLTPVNSDTEAVKQDLHGKNAIKDNSAWLKERNRQVREGAK